MGSEEEVVNFVLTVEETNVVLAGLAELPAKISFDVINKIRKQALPQIEQGS